MKSVIDKKILYILVNSPGELSGWMAPIVLYLKQHAPELKIVAVTLPCPYASGGEKQAALSIGVQDVITLWQFLTIKTKKVKKGQSNFAQILQLGGDPMWGFLLHLKTGYDWLIYTKRPKFKHFVSHYFVPNRETEEKFAKVLPCNKYSLAGNLILDSVKLTTKTVQPKEGARFEENKKKESKIRLAILPGSRPFEYERAFSFYPKVAELLHKKLPNLSIFFPLAPTAKKEVYVRSIKNAGYEYIEEEGTCLIRIAEDFYIDIVKQNTFDAIKNATMAVAFPGTNNLQIAFLGTPLICLAPTNYAEEIPLDGLLGLIPNCALTRKLKRIIIEKINKKLDFASLPNILAKKQIVPEIRRVLWEDDCAKIIEKYLLDTATLEKIKEGYKTIPFDSGADKVIGEYIIKALG